MWMPFLHQAAVQEHITVAEDNALHQLSWLGSNLLCLGHGGDEKAFQIQKFPGVFAQVMDNRIGGEAMTVTVLSQILLLKALSSAQNEF